MAERHGIADVCVFGSMARGDTDENSDVDLLVKLRPGMTGLALAGLPGDARDLLGRKVDVLTEGALHPALCARRVEDALPS